MQEGADFILAESFEFLGEALIALDCIKKYGNGEKFTYFICFERDVKVIVLFAYNY